MSTKSKRMFKKRIRHAGPGTIGVVGRKRIKKIKNSESINEREKFYKRSGE